MTPDPPDWRPVATDPPPEGVVVETCVRFHHLERTHLPLSRHGRYWDLPDGKPYVPYHEPTHWRPLT